MHIAGVLVKLRWIWFWSKSSQTFFKDIHPERLIRSNNNVDAQVKLVTIDEKWVCHISWYDWSFVNVELIKRFNDMDAAATRRVCWFDNPDISFWLCLPQFLIMSMEIMEFIRQDVSVRDEIKLRSTKSLLHLYIVETKSVFSGNFVTLWEVVDALEFIQTFIKITFAWTCRPKDIPLVRVCIIEVVCLQNRTDQLCITFKKLVEHFAVIYVIATTRSLSRYRRIQ